MKDALGPTISHKYLLNHVLNDFWLRSIEFEILTIGTEIHTFFLGHSFLVGCVHISIEVSTTWSANRKGHSAQHTSNGYRKYLWNFIFKLTNIDTEWKLTNDSKHTSNLIISGVVYFLGQRFFAFLPRLGVWLRVISALMQNDFSKNWIQISQDKKTMDLKYFIFVFCHGMRINCILVFFLPDRLFSYPNRHI